MWWDDSYMFAGGWMMMGALVIWLLLVIAVIAALVYFVASWRSWQGRSTTAPPVATQSAARAILDERYARGDISTEDYLERITHLVA